MDLVRVLESEGPPVTLYHWDADGIISAMHVIMAAGPDTILYPPKFTYKVTEDYINGIKDKIREAGSNVIVIIDIAYPGHVIERIARETGVGVIVIDHHYQENPPRGRNITYINPAAGGDPKGMWPSAVHVFASVTGVYHPALAAASIVGDLGPKAKANKYYQNYMVESGLDPIRDYELIRDVVAQLEAIDVTGKYEGLKWVPKVHVIGGQDPVKSILGDPLLTALRMQAQAEFEDLLTSARRGLRDEGDGVLGVILEGEGRHISRLARSLAAEYRGNVIVIGYYSNSTGEARVYARTYGINKPLISLKNIFKERGYSVGGKYQYDNNVIGVECSRRELVNVYRLMVNSVRKLLRQ